MKTILFDAYSGAVPRLRWYIEGKDSGRFIKLVANTNTVVKEWGPLRDDFLGAWHHLAVTVRMARQYSRTSSDPAVIVTQAFLFIDGVHVSAGSAFLALDLQKQLVFETHRVCQRTKPVLELPTDR